MNTIQKRQDASAAAALVLIPFLALGRALCPGKVLSPADNLLTMYPWEALAPHSTPANGLLSDVTMMFHPWLIYAGEEISRGRFPLWNPHSFTGAPFFANPQTALLFPLTALAYVLPAPLALSLIPILKLATAGLTMYWFLRVVSVGPPAAFVSALTFMLNGSLIAWLQWTNSTPAIFLPLLLGLTERSRDTATLRPVALLAAVVALVVFAGYPPGLFMCLLAASAWALSRARGAAGGAGRFLLRYAGSIGLGLGLGAVQLLPFLEYMQESAVLAKRALWMPASSLPARSLVAFLMPYYYGSPTSRDFWGPWNFNEIAVSIGLVPWVVLPVALVVGWRDPRARFLAVMAAVVGTILYGFPGSDVVRAALPGVSFVIGQRLAPLLVFAVVALSAVGLHALFGAVPGPARSVEWLVKGMFVVMTGGALGSLVHDYAAFSREPMKVPVPLQYVWFLLLVTIATLLVVRRIRAGDAGRHAWLGLTLVQALCLLPLASTYNPIVDARWLYPAPPSVPYLQRESARDHGRVLLQPNVPMLYGLFEAGGYDGMTPRRVEQIVGEGGVLSMSASDSLPNDAVFAAPALDLLGVRRIAVRPDVVLRGERFVLEYAGQDARVYGNPQALPRVFLVPSARCVTDEDAIDLIWKRGVQFRDEALLERCDAASPAGPPGRVSRSEIRAYDADRVALHAVTDTAAYLVLTDTWFPGWRARIDGAETAVLRANHAFRAVRLEAGEHEIVFSYEPDSVRLGLWITLLAAAITAGLALSMRRRPRPAVAGLVLGLLVGLVLGPGAAPADAALPRAPFDLVVSPSTVAEREPIAIRIDPGPPSSDDRRFDLYLVVYVGWDVDSFVSPAGTRSIDPVPYRRGLSLRDLTPIAADWRDAPPVESLVLAAVAVKASTSPLSRTNWLYRPTLVALRVQPSLPGDVTRLEVGIVVGSLLFVTLAATLLVIAYPDGGSITVRRPR
jgi:hypothetical protein